MHGPLQGDAPAALQQRDSRQTHDRVRGVNMASWMERLPVGCGRSVCAKLKKYHLTVFDYRP
eukprot:1574463-Amphidinium_carterae.1